MKERGFALITTLWVMVMLIAVALGLSVQARQGSLGVRNFSEYTDARYTAVSACEEAIAYLLTDRDPTVDYVDAGGNLRTDTERPAFSSIKTSAESAVEVKITDEESRLNINYLNMPTLRKLLGSINIPEDGLQEITDSLADWVDPDDLHHLSGAEDEYYGILGYRTKNKPLDVPEELLLVKGFLPEYLYGNQDFKPLGLLVTTWSKGINVNTMSGELLEVIGFNRTEVEYILKQRENGGLKTPPHSLAGFAVTASQNFRIDVSVPIKDSPQRLRVVSVINRSPDGTGYNTLYWKETVESGRT